MGDRKTPNACARVCEEVSNKGLECRFLDISWQDGWGKAHPEFYREIPYNNETRRNIGYLCALEAGCERLISIDDDNFPTESDFIGGHSLTGTEWNGDQQDSDSGFHNVCSHLLMSPSRHIYPRGYPFRLRGGSEDYTLSVIKDKEPVTVGTTAGLWTGAPDVDATTWLNGHVESIDFHGPDRLVLGPETWSPINTQNTSVMRELIPAFFCIPMGYDVCGIRIERYGDIWGGYFLQALTKGTKYRVCFGEPIVEHRRNAHDYIDDLRFEFWGMMLTDWLLEHLKSAFDPSSENIVDRVDELAEFLIEISSTKLPGNTPAEAAEFLVDVSRKLHAWASVCRKFL